ncbi:PadR family transcriptional regulator [Sphingomonas corticis]|jgi:DNA-binding PadR family transcriptional regulator|uniref:PadR family transcriptional regulator n=1 Tax=Sphingomonas corticis TaxID=2722791 RepID=A0ABX1CM45_9SPHN|nr:PadR family transcriptional regulator [Sphingomonas corticis]NJR79056.1 PadR family transcriptional regulator [Sphingomonas corticis]
MFGHHHPRCGTRGSRSFGPFNVEWSFDAPRGPRGGGYGGGRGRRMFDGGELRLVLLRLIADEPRHGYELIKAVEELTGGAYAPSPGTVYPTLTMLGEMGLTREQASDDTRKRFEVTPEGAMHLEENREQVEELIARLQAVGARRERADKAPIRRAMGNLRVALGHRLEKGEFSDDTLHDIAALIDEVAQKIERLR